MKTQKKRCCQCNMIVESGYNFCTNCGSTRFEFMDKAFPMEEKAKNNLLESMTKPVEPVKKKLSKGKMIAVIAAVILFILVCIAIIFGGSSDDVPAVEYTTGEIINSAYYNEWADLRIVIPDGYSTVGEDVYGLTGSETSDNLLMIQEPFGSNIIIQTESASELFYISEKQCLEEIKSGVKELFESTYAEYKQSFTFLVENETIEIADNTYHYCRYEADFEMNGTNICMFQDLFVRKINDRLLVISIASTSKDELEMLRSCIKKYEVYEDDMIYENDKEVTTPQTYACSLELSNDIDSFQVQVMDVIYQFPMMYADFCEMGWSVSEEYNFMDTDIESGFEELIWFEKDGMLMSCNVYNADISIQTVDKCVISGIATIEPMENDELYVYIPGGFKVGEAKKEDVLAFFREPDYILEMENGVTYVEYETQNVYASVELMFNKKDVLYDINIDIPKEPEGFQYSEVDTGYIAQYVAPTEMTDMLTDRIVRLGGDLYQLPVTVKAMIENGWTTSDETKTIAGGNIYFTDLKRNGQTLSVILYNYNDYAVQVSQGYIQEFSESLSDSDFEVSGGITMQMTEDDVLSLIENNDFEYGVEHREDGNLYKIYYGNNEFETYFYIKFLVDEVEYINISAGEEWIK